MMLGARSLDVGSCRIGMASVLDSDKELMRGIGVPACHRLMSQLIFEHPARRDIEIPGRSMDVVLSWINESTSS